MKVPETLHPGLDGNISMMLKDPDGHNVEFVEYRPGLAAYQKLRQVPAGYARLRAHHPRGHTRSADRAAADRFYKDILGFHEIWHGGMTDDRTDWVDMRVPDGTDWLEYMLNVTEPVAALAGRDASPGARACRASEPATRRVVARGMNPEKPKIGRDGKWQLNLYDPERHARGTDGAEAGREALLLADPAVIGC